MRRHRGATVTGNPPGIRRMEPKVRDRCLAGFLTVRRHGQELRTEPEGQQLKTESDTLKEATKHFLALAALIDDYKGCF